MFAQFKEETGPIVLANTFLVPKEDRGVPDPLSEAGGVHEGSAGIRLPADAQGNGGQSTPDERSVWESTEAPATAFGSPEFQRMAAEFPDDIVSYPHVFERVDIGHCSWRGVTVLVSDPALHGTLATRSDSDTPDERTMPIASSRENRAVSGRAARCVAAWPGWRGDTAGRRGSTASSRVGERAGLRPRRRVGCSGAAGRTTRGPRTPGSRRQAWVCSAATSSAIWTVLSAAPLRRLSLERKSARPFSRVSSRRMRPT